MIPFKEAFDITMGRFRILKQIEQVKLENAVGRILAEDVFSDREIPPFNRVAMDGYACRQEDVRNDLEIVEIVPAGHLPEKIIGRNQCAKVMTGCPLPQGADLVFMVEYSKELPGNRVRCTCNDKEIKFRNYAKQGEDISSGEMVLEKGTLIQPRHIGVMASVGYAEPMVARQPRVGIIATGDEIVEPWKLPESFQIRNSNSYQLITQVKRSGGWPVYYGIAPDSGHAIESAVNLAKSECDVLLLSGGVSMGDFDLVPGILEKNGFEILFNKVALKPGKPTTLAVSDQTVCFGMPGNPVSTFIVFEILVRPFLYKLTGHEYKPHNLNLQLENSISRKKAEREEWTPVIITNDGKVRPLKYHGSGHFHSLTHADGIIRIPAGVFEIKKGRFVYVRQI